MTAGEAEVPRDDILAFEKLLRAAGVDTVLHVAPDMPHNAAFFAAYHPSGQGVIDAVVKFVDAHLG